MSPPRPSPLSSPHPASLHGSPSKPTQRSSSLTRRKPVPRLPVNHPFANPSPAPSSSGSTATGSSVFELALPVSHVDSLFYDTRTAGQDEACGSAPPPPPRRDQHAKLQIDSLDRHDSCDSIPDLEPPVRSNRLMSAIEWANILEQRTLNRALPPLPKRLESVESLRFERESTPRHSIHSSTRSFIPGSVPGVSQGVTWDIAQELDFVDEEYVHPPSWVSRSGPGSPLGAYRKPSRNAKSRKHRPTEPFDVHALPSTQRLWEAGTCMLRDEEGGYVRFSELFAGPVATVSTPVSVEGTKPTGRCKTVVFFIRHFWCGQCQDYMFASLALLDPVAIQKAGINIVIISNGSWRIIKKYRQLFNCPFPVYVDGPRRLYRLMGMTYMTNDFGPMKGRAAYHQRAVPGQLIHGIGNGLFRVPLADPGTLTQLGGEFILGPGWKCDFAHRMSNTSDHMEAPDVLRLAGCDTPTYDEHAKAQSAALKRGESLRLEKEIADWREGREDELERIRRRKAERRGEAYTTLPYEPELDARFRAVMLEDEKLPSVEVSDGQVTVVI